ncbi:hypothetical protein EJ02DRAFT_458761 [Clathrospora elynae]|uniref:Uncharacterized protein n=1 Tax=Clathrospora elynae TaxID=706981 RepID=A0A6A5SCJ9_9PLEO|nr:hypothetical protein EJ02DRAFT_458761 [Clathrospora elynae]
MHCAFLLALLLLGFLVRFGSNLQLFLGIIVGVISSARERGFSGRTTRSISNARWLMPQSHGDGMKFEENGQYDAYS